nr:hypothetical protein GCM10025732_17250 [Glycomyces mayteni]
MARNLTAEVRLLRGDADGARALAESARDAHRAAGHRAGEEWSLRVLGAAVSTAR